MFEIIQAQVANSFGQFVHENEWIVLIQCIQLPHVVQIVVLFYGY